MLSIIRGETFKIKKGYMSVIMVIIYLLSGMIYFLQCYNNIIDTDISDLAGDDTIRTFSVMLGELVYYGNDVKSTIIIFGVFTLFGLLSALFIVPIFTSIFIADEFQTKGLHQLVCKGVKRYRIVLSKYISICGFITLMDVCAMAIGSAITLLLNNQGNIKLFIVQLICFGMKLLLMNYAFVAACVFFSFTIKNAAAVMPINFIFIICLFGQISTDLLSAKMLIPIITFIGISMIFLIGITFQFEKMDI